MMHEEHHKSKSFGRDTFSRFAQKHDMKISLQPLDRYGLMPSDKLKEAKNFLVVLTLGPKMMNFPMAFPEYRRHLPPIDDVLESMANEIAIHETFGNNAQAFANFTKIPLAEAKSSLEGASAAAGAFRAFLGPLIYREIMSITEPRGPMRM
jgi:hypothetical protein